MLNIHTEIFQTSKSLQCCVGIKRILKLRKAKLRRTTSIVALNLKGSACVYCILLQ